MRGDQHQRTSHPWPPHGHAPFLSRLQVIMRYHQSPSPSPESPQCHPRRSLRPSAPDRHPPTACQAPSLPSPAHLLRPHVSQAFNSYVYRENLKKRVKAGSPKALRARRKELEREVASTTTTPVTTTTTTATPPTPGEACANFGAPVPVRTVFFVSTRQFWVSGVVGGFPLGGLCS